MTVELLEREHRAQVGETAQRGAQLQQARLGALARRQSIELVVTHRAQENRLGIQSGSQGIRRQRCAILLNRHAANAPFVKLQRVAAQVRHFAQYRDALLGDFGADAVSGCDQNLQFHSCSLLL